MPNGGRLRVALPIALHQAGLIGASARVAVLGANPGRFERFGEQVWRTIAP